MQVGLPAIEHREDDKRSRGGKHQDGEEEEVLLVVHLHGAVGVADEIIHSGGEKIAHRDGEEPKRHDRALHLVRRLGVGELEAGDGDHRFAERQDDVGEELPVDARLSAGVDHLLDVPNNDVTKRRQEKANANFSQRREREEAIHHRIDHVIHERNEKQDQDRIGGLHLRGQKLNAEPIQIHVLRLKRPGTAAALIPERPEHRDEDINDREPAKRAEAFAAEDLFHETHPSRRDVDEFLATGPEEDGRDDHHDAGKTERPARPEARIGQQKGTGDGRDERAGINREIEPAKNFREQVFVRVAELIAHIRRDARLDAAGTERDQPEPNHQSHPGVIQRERKMTEAVNDREPENRLIFADESFRQNRAEDRAGNKPQRRRGRNSAAPPRRSSGPAGPDEFIMYCVMKMIRMERIP